MTDKKPITESSPDTARKCLTSRGRQEIAYPPNLRQIGEHDMHYLHQVRPPEETEENFSIASFVFASNETLGDGQVSSYNRGNQMARTSDIPTDTDENLDLSMDFSTLSAWRSETSVLYSRDDTNAPNAGFNRIANDSSPHLDERHGNPTCYATSTSDLGTQHSYIRPRNYEYPAMASREARLQTFHSWPLHAPMGQDLADANMFYEGPFDEAGEIVTDQVVCYKCGQTFRQWQPFDDPVDEHMRINKDCFYIKWKEEL